MPYSQGYENSKVNKALTPLPIPHLTGMKLQEDISLNGFVFNKIDEYGVVWVITDIGGWWQHPSPDMLDIKRGWGDGSYDVKGRWNARDITLEGVILCPDPSLAAAARNRLVAATNLVYSGGWLKTNETPTKASWVRLSGEPKIESVTARGRIEFSIGLRAADPLKYEWNASDTDGYFSTEILAKSISPSRTGKATITNNGNFKVDTYITVTGSIVGPATILNETTGDYVTVIGSLVGDTTSSMTVTQAGLDSGVATIGTASPHGLTVGKTFTITNMVQPFSGTFTVASVPSTTQFTYLNSGFMSVRGTPIYTRAYGDASELYTFATPPPGQIGNGQQLTGTLTSTTTVATPDVLEIDTYNRSVFLNGEYNGARSKLSVYNDWITLAPGANVISFSDAGATSASSGKIKVEYRSGWLA